MDVVDINESIGTQKLADKTPFTIEWWFEMYNFYSRMAWANSRIYTLTGTKRSLDEYTKCYEMVNWIQGRLIRKYRKYDKRIN